MYVSLPELPVGVYTVEYVAQSAEDGHDEPGTFAFNVGIAPPSAGEPVEQPIEQPAAGASTLPVDGAECTMLDAY